MKAQITDLDNPIAPGGGALVTISVAAFMKWMSGCHFQRATANVNQEVYFIHQGSPRMIGNALVTPNWHITAMTTFRVGGDCRNFHFKVEIGKAASHYWHYVVHRDTNGQFVWVGDPNPHNGATNQGGGGAAGNLMLLKQNLDETESVARQHGIDGKCGKRTQQQMMRALWTLVNNGTLVLANGRITHNGN